MKFSSEDNSAVDRFLESWTKQLARTMQAFNGEPPAVTWSPVKRLPANEIENVFWWKQVVEGTSRFTVWIGAHESAWNSLGRASEDADDDDAKAAYLEILSKTQQSTASAISLRLPEPLQCRKGQVSSTPKGEGIIYAFIGVTLSGEQLPALLFAAEHSICEALGGLVGLEDFGERGPLETGQTGLMLDRLLTLEMPVSVALGRTEMPIRDLLKVVSGSVVELNQQVDDCADLIVHGTVVARGEIVSVKGNYGLRIKEIISQKDRIDLYGKG